MLESDIPRVAEIHHRALPRDYCSQLGLEFLRDHFYPHFLAEPGAIGIVAGSGEPDGFVVGAPALGYYGRLVRGRWVGLITAWARTRAQHPSRLGSDLDVARLLLNPGALRPGERDAELLYIAVDPSAQRRSLGSRLTAGLLGRLSAEPYDRCLVKTLAATPETVRFYERNGFSTVEQQLGRVWLSAPVPSSDSPSEARLHA
jgi:ribosomal protein S18 acetylase RimI-like enzyme